uniref:CEBPZ opposite strand n=1 Tax=Periophthalmus magnuspinnatus TaxID=409849 RepID=A0A3B4AY15_9GOBI
MMRPLEPVAKRLLKAVIVVELLGVFGAYGLFHAMNNSQGPTSETLNYLLKVHSYYLSNEWAGVYGIRERDREAWRQD